MTKKEFERINPQEAETKALYQKLRQFTTEAEENGILKKGTGKFVNELIEHNIAPERIQQILNGNTLIKRWYMNTYPNDKTATKMSDDVSFSDIRLSLNDGIDIYDTLGVYDSALRERVFEALVDIYDIEYDTIYYLYTHDAAMRKNREIENTLEYIGYLKYVGADETTIEAEKAKLAELEAEFEKLK